MKTDPVCYGFRDENPSRIVGRRPPGALLLSACLLLSLSMCQGQQGGAESKTTVMPEEVLLIISPSADEEARQEAQALPVVQEISSRVRVVQNLDGKAAKTGRRDGIFVLAEGPLPEAAASFLDEMEQLFAEAWLSRTPEETRDRPGDNLPWDTRGFEPPDPDTTIEIKGAE